MRLRSRDKQETSTPEISNVRRENNHRKKKKEVIELNGSKEKRNRTKAEAKMEVQRTQQ